MGESMGTLRPVKQQEQADGATIRGGVNPIGDVTATVRYRELVDDGLIEVLDETQLAYTEGADGWALYDQGGDLLTVIDLVVPQPGYDFRLDPGWGFKAHRAYAAQQQKETAAAGGSGR